MKRLVFAIVACLILSGCCGFLEPGLEQAKNQFSEIQLGMPRAKAARILKDHWFDLQEHDHMIVGQRSYGECVAVSRFFRVTVVFDDENRVTEVYVDQVRIPL